MKICLFLLAFCLSVSALLAADDEAHHHEELTEAQLGTVHFPSSCLAGEQKAVERGVAMLHSFWYEEAEKQFEQIGKEDSQCAIAHWGVAMSLWHQLWNRPDPATLERGGAQLKTAKSLPATPREKDYIAALSKFYEHPRKAYQKRATAYSNAMEKVYQRHPDDHEAAAFYALSVLAADHDKTNANRKRAAAVLEKLFAEEPNHPGVAHYLIHTYDKPDMAQLGLPAARRYAQLAPAAPHALHMPAHIFARLGLWQDDIDSNVRSIAATQKEAAEHMGGEGHQFHAMDCTPTCKPVANRTRRRSSMKYALCRRCTTCMAWDLIRGCSRSRRFLLRMRWNYITGMRRPSFRRSAELAMEINL